MSPPSCATSNTAVTTVKINAWSWSRLSRGETTSSLVHQSCGSTFFSLNDGLNVKATASHGLLAIWSPSSLGVLVFNGRSAHSSLGRQPSWNTLRGQSDQPQASLQAIRQRRRSLQHILLSHQRCPCAPGRILVIWRRLPPKRSWLSRRVRPRSSRCPGVATLSPRLALS